jgi:fermentation-respiration switch protein FrsA (DUF1100 family)
MRLPIPQAKQILIHGSADDVVPPDFSRRYVGEKKKTHENVTLVEISKAEHFDLIDPRSTAWPRVQQEVLRSLDFSADKRTAR